MLSEVPPTEVQPALARPEGSSWPTVIGVLEIVLGSIGILMYACGGCMSVIMPAFLDSRITEGDVEMDPFNQAQLDVHADYLVWNLANSAVLLGLGVLVLIAGIKLARRQAAGMKLSRIWAIGRIIWAIPATIVGIIMMSDIMASMEEASQDAGATGMPEGFMSMISGFGVVSTIVTTIFVVAMPVFILIWFSRSKIQDEVRSWSAMSAH